MSRIRGATVAAKWPRNRAFIRRSPRQPLRHRVVTHVLGTFCHLCLGPLSAAPVFSSRRSPAQSGDRFAESFSSLAKKSRWRGRP
jgi:hypothetical protein